VIGNRFLTRDAPKMGSVRFAGHLLQCLVLLFIECGEEIVDVVFDFLLI
jgi:hypothetical protein